MNNNIPQGYKESPLGVIPNDWEVKRLGDVCSHFKSGMGITASNISNDGEYPVYGGNGLRGYTNDYTHDGNYVLIGRQGALCGNVNQVVGKNYISEHAIAVQMDGCNDWLKYKLDFWNLNRFSESSAQPGLSVEKLVRYKLSLPPLAEQQRIAEVLGTWDVAIEKQGALVDKLTERKCALMQQLLTAKKRLPNFSAPWKTVTLKSILSKLSNGLTYDSTLQNGTPVTRIETISMGVVNYDKVGYAQESNIESFKLQKNDILYSHINSIQHIGKVALYKGEKPLYHGMNLLLLRVNQNVNAEYFYYFLCSASARRKAKSLAKQAVNQASISTSELNKWVFKLPSLKEQAAIARILTTADREIEQATAKLEALRSQKLGLMQQLLTGKKRLKK